jgi:hypothetical protein
VLLGVYFEMDEFVQDSTAISEDAEPGYGFLSRRSLSG